MNCRGLRPWLIEPQGRWQHLLSIGSVFSSLAGSTKGEDVSSSIMRATGWAVLANSSWACACLLACAVGGGLQHALDMIRASAAAFVCFFASY